ncbi:MAG: helix-turn-helix domain-containing protein [Proteobacteria bacterium]|nr:helix-turn-helix domain-containing protein [Pseudomonadota bacterium]
MQPFGRYLKTEREKRGIRLEEIASSTKIHIQNLALMEEDRWKELPQDPFIRGFISAYARYIGLDNRETLKLFSQYQSSPDSIASENIEASSSQSSSVAHPNAEVPPVEKKLKQEPNPLSISKSYPLRTVLLAALLILILVFVIAKKGEKESTSQTLPLSSSSVAPNGEPPAASAVPNTTIETQADMTTPTSTVLVSSIPTTTESPANALQTVPAASPAQASAPVAVAPIAPTPIEPPSTTLATQANAPQAGHEIVVKGKYRSWMKIVIDDEPAKESYLEEGAQVTFQAKNKIKLVLGNSAGSIVTHNGEETNGNKYAGTIRYYIFPKGSRFPQEKPKAKQNTENSDEGMEPTTGDSENSTNNSAD